MNIVILAWRDTEHPQTGGSEVVVDQLAARLSARGHDVRLLHGGASGRHRYVSIRIGGDYMQYLRAPFAFARHGRSADVVVDVENGIPYFAPLWQRRPVIGLVHHIHTEQWAMQFPKPIAAIGRWLECRLMPKIYRHTPFVAVSRSTADGLTHLGIPSHNITTIEMGLEFEALEPAPTDEPRFLVLSRLVPHKRIHLALQMWEFVRPVTGGTLVIVGDGPEYETLRAQAGSAVEFTGRVDEERKRIELSKAWLLIHPAHHEGWGTVVMEAAAASVPTIAFDVPGVRDSIENGRTGSLAADREAFCADWIGLALDTDRRTSMAEAARSRAATFTWERAVSMFERVLEESTDRSRPTT